jgi:hypothetical protein
MLPLAWLLATALALSGDAGGSEPEIRAAGGEVTIHARNLPLSQILDRLSQATGMDLTYEGARPTTPVTVSVEGISEAEAILKLMEGLGVSYVFRTDASGQRVDLLIVSGAGAGAVVAAASQASTPADTYEEPVADYGHIPLDPAVLEAAGGQVKPDLNNPYLGLPPQHFPQPVPGAAPQGPGMQPAPPFFPQAASYPR